MTCRSLITFALLLTAGSGSSSRAQAPAPPTLAVEQLSMVVHSLGTRDSGNIESVDPPPESWPVLAHADGTNAIMMPTGEWSPDATRLLVTTDGDIHVTSATLGSRTNLTNHPAADVTPRWSPDGARVAFLSDRDGPFDLYLMDSDGTNVVRLRTGVNPSGTPTWSPDGTRIAFRCAVDLLAPLNSDICAINADGSGFARLTTTADRQEYAPDWSPDGSRILFSDSSRLFVMNPDGGSITHVETHGPAANGRWSSDGTRLAFDGTTVIMSEWTVPAVLVMNADGTGLIDLGWGRGPVWRPFADGSNHRPVASYVFDCVGLTCTLDASASSDSDGRIVEYGWQFSDGTIAAGVVVTHTFATAEKDAVLMVMDDDAALATTGWLPVNYLPVAAFTSICIGRTCTFDASISTDRDGYITYFGWRIGNGETPSGMVLTYTFPSAGTYWVGLAVQDNRNGSDGHEEQVIVTTANNPPATPDFFFSCPLLTCEFRGLAADLDGDPLVYAWNFGDGTRGSGTSTGHTYAAGGTYAVVLTVTDSGGLTATRSKNVPVTAPTAYLHVGDLSGASSSELKTWTSKVRIVVHDDAHNLVTNAVVDGAWNSGNSARCETGPRGDCEVTQPLIPKKQTSATFTVSTINRAGNGYTAAKNHDPDGGSTGTTIKIIRP